MIDDMQPARDLAALGVDSPRLRWLAARDYLNELSDGVTRSINRVALIATYADYAEQNVFQRPDGIFCIWSHWPCRDGMIGVHDVRYTATDWLEARVRTLEPYKGATRNAALKILKEFLLLPFDKEYPSDRF
jgi:hypothetical protein